MKKTNKILSVILCLAVALIPLTAWANESSPKDNLKVTVTTDKGSYRLFDKAVITVTVENVGEAAVSNVSAGVSGGNYLPLRGSTTYCKAPVLMPGKSCSVSFTAILSPDTQGLNFIQSLLLKFRGLFVKTDKIPLTGISPEYAQYTNTQVTHAGVTASVSAYAVCGEALTVAEGETAEDLLAMYNSAVKNTNEKGEISGANYFELSKMEGEGSFGLLLNEMIPIAQNALRKQKYEVNSIPGEGELTMDDIEGIAYLQNAGKTSLLIFVKGQTDGMDGDPENSGPVSKAIGSIGSLDAAFEELGAEIESGKESLTFEYFDSYIACEIDEDGIITGGTWSYTVNMNYDDFKILFGGINLSISGKITFSSVIEF